MMNEEKMTAEELENNQDAGTAEEANEPTPEELLIKENEELKTELADSKDKHLRLMAEYDNFRKRTAQEKLSIYPDATAKAVEAFLPLADNFERALMAETADEKYKAGVQMIYNQLCETFKKLNVEVIDRVGKEFDPRLENAVSQITDENLGENVVAQVYQKGYKMGDKVIRPAMVIVANC